MPVSAGQAAAQVAATLPAAMQPAVEVSSPQSDFQAALNVVESWSKPAALPVTQPEQTPTQEAPPSGEGASPAEAALEAEVEAPAEGTEAETPTEGEQPRRHKLKYRGQDIEVDEAELRAGYLMHRDYTQKTQELSKEREEIPSKIKAQVEPVVKQYQERLQLFEKAVWQALAPEVNNTDWNALARENPAEWAQRMQAVTNVNNVLQAVKQEQERLAKDGQESMRQTVQKQAKEAVEILQRDIPDWSQETYNAVRKNGEKYGFSAEELAQIADPRAIKALYAALQWDKLQAAKPAVTLKVADVPKVVKPGTVQKQDPKAQKWTEAMTKFQRGGGKDKDALEVAKMFVG